MTRFLAALIFLACSAARAQTDDLSNLAPPAVHAAADFSPAGSITALTLLLGGVAFLKGRRRD
jgi:hypothetical protein